MPSAVANLALTNRTFYALCHSSDQYVSHKVCPSILGQLGVKLTPGGGGGGGIHHQKALPASLGLGYCRLGYAALYRILVKPIILFWLLMWVNLASHAINLYYLTRITHNECVMCNVWWAYGISDDDNNHHRPGNAQATSFPLVARVYGCLYFSSSCSLSLAHSLPVKTEWC